MEGYVPIEREGGYEVPMDVWREAAKELPSKPTARNGTCSCGRLGPLYGTMCQSCWIETNAINLARSLGTYVRPRCAPQLARVLS